MWSKIGSAEQAFSRRPLSKIKRGNDNDYKNKNKNIKIHQNTGSKKEARPIT